MRFDKLISTLAVLLHEAHAANIRVADVTTLGNDPRTVNRLNGESFQQDALVTFNGYQYAAFYVNDASNASVRHPSLARRALKGQTSGAAAWELFSLTDYDQTEDDGHDIISLGISQGDGTLHLGFDQHDNNLNYRISKAGVATDPTGTEWSPSLFGPLLDHLPGLESLDKSVYFVNVTYPRFLSIPISAHDSAGNEDLILELRVGRSGLGDDWLYKYTPNKGWEQIGKYLEGVNNNAYINGIDFDSQGNLCTTWTYRDYVNDTGQDVAVQAGPNGPENNHDMNFAFSTDLGTTWLNNWNQTIADMEAQEPIIPVSAGITIFGIPKYGGILNQEAQAVDREGRIHVLNRENTTGTERWYHYWRSTTARWTRTALPLAPELQSVNNVTGTPTVVGKRGKLVTPPQSPHGSLLAILPSNAPNSSAISILRSTAVGHFRDWEAVWEAPGGCGWEPLFDRYRLDTSAGGDGILSLFLINGTAIQVMSDLLVNAQSCGDALIVILGDQLLAVLLHAYAALCSRVLYCARETSGRSPSRAGSAKRLYRDVRHQIHSVDEQHRRLSQSLRDAPRLNPLRPGAVCARSHSRSEAFEHTYALNIDAESAQSLWQSLGYGIIPGSYIYPRFQGRSIGSLCVQMSFLHSLKARLDGRQASNDASGAVPATSEEASVDVKPPGSVEADVGQKTEPLSTIEVMTVANPELNPGELSFEEDARGGMGRHLGVFSCTMLIVGKIIGTGIFSTPSSILGSVGSVGASLMLWVLGFALSFCGLFIWLEFGSMFPRSGGEKVYLEAVYRRPKHLATVFFAANAILLGFTASGCIVFAQNILVTAGHDAERWTVRGIAIGVIVFATLVHGLTPRLGVWLINGLGISKIVILLFIVVSGWVVLSGRTGIEDPYANFRNSFAGSSDSSNDYATATFKVLHAYAGWENVNYVLNDVKDPVRTLKIAGPLGLGISAVLYLLANVSYFAAATKEEITNSGVTVASLFFKNVFGEAAQKALTVFVALSANGSNLGFARCCSSYRNVVTVTYASGRINQELAKEGIPLPFGNRFWASTWPTGKTPLPGLLIHLIPSVIVIIAPPPDIAFPFILDVEQYPQQIINLLIVIGLFWLRWSKPDAPRVFKVWLPFAVFFLAAAVFLLVAPFLRPENGVGDTPPLPYYLYCLVGIGVMAFGVLYWAMWRIVPGWFGYEYVPHKATLSDGTVVTLFSKKRID